MPASTAWRITSGSQFGDTISLPPAFATASTSSLLSMVPPPTMESAGAISSNARIASSAPTRLSGTSSTRKPASNKVCPTCGASDGVSPRRKATSGHGSRANKYILSLSMRYSFMHDLRIDAGQRAQCRKVNLVRLPYGGRHAEKFQRFLILRFQFRRTNDLYRRCAITGIALLYVLHFAADQQAGQIGPCMRSRHAVGDDQRAAAESHMDEAAAGGGAQSFLECIGCWLALLHQCGQRAVAGEQSKQLSGHESRELGDGAFANMYPFAVRARMQDPSVRCRQEQCAEYLGFFASHHVRRALRIVIAIAGNDAATHVRQGGAELGQ